MRLKLLVDKGLVGKRYEPVNRLQGKPIVYYLTPKGMKVIRDQNAVIDDAMIKYCYRDKTFSDQFIDHNLDIFALSMKLKQLHPGVKFFSKRQIAKHDFLPERKPDGILVRPNDTKPNPDLYFFDIIPPNHQRLELRRRLNRYLEYFDYKDWDINTSAFPRSLLVLTSNKLETIARRQAYRLIENSYCLYFDCYTTTIDRIKQATPTNKNLWIKVDDPDERLPLESFPFYHYDDQ